MKATFRTYGSRCCGRGVFGGVLLCLALCATAAELHVTTEYIYPTSYEVVQTTRIGPGGTVIPNVMVIPRDFETREVGVHLVVEAIVSNLGGGIVNIAVNGQARLDGSTDMMLAAAAGDAAQVKRLLAARTDANARNESGSTALMGASAGGFDGLVKLLLDRKANVNLRSKNGSTALLFAARNGHLEVVRRLLACGARIDDADEDGMTPLLAAAKAGYADVVELLTRQGADTRATDRNGRTAPAMMSARPDPVDPKLAQLLGAQK